MEEKGRKSVISKKKLIINLIIMLLVTGLTIYSLFKNDAFADLPELKNLSGISVLIIICSVMAYVLCDSFVIYRSFKGVNKNMSYKDCIGCYLYGNLGSSITPSKVGHIPFMIYYMEKKGNTIDQSLNSVTQCQLIYSIDQSIAYFIMFVVCLVNNVTLKINDTTTIHLYWIGLIGIGLAFLASGVFMIMAFCPPIKKLITHICGWFVSKTKKNITKEEYIAKESAKMDLYSKQVKYLLSHLYEALPSMIVYFGFLAFNNCLPYIIYICISGAPFDFGQFFFFFALYQVIGYISNIAPVPGNSGFAEGTFYLVFSNVIPNAYLGNSLLIWRIANYYLLLLIDLAYFGITLFIIDPKDDNNLKIAMNDNIDSTNKNES